MKRADIRAEIDDLVSSLRDRGAETNAIISALVAAADGLEENEDDGDDLFKDRPRDQT